jgi:hypothetical protein
MFLKKEETEQSAQVAEMIKKGLSEYSERGEDGRLKMTISLPDESVLDNMARSLARIIDFGWKH